MKKTGELRCTFPGCQSPGPFDSAGGLGSHKRRSHGIAAVVKANRPPGGTLRCELGCVNLEPYQTVGGRALHYRHVHGIVTVNKDSVLRRQRRADARPAFEPPPLPPPPASAAIASHEPLVPRSPTPGEREHLRKRLLYVVSGTWARELDLAPAVIRDLIASLCASNFEKAGRKRAST